MRIKLFKMKVVDRVKQVVKDIYLEPVVFLFYICFGIFYVTSQQLYIEKACIVNLNNTDAVCDNIKDHNPTQIETQKLISEIQGINGALQSLPTIPVAFLAGLFITCICSLSACRIILEETLSSLLA